jgi:hypothetical protein
MAEFCQQVVDYIHANVCAHMPGLESYEAVRTSDVDKEAVCRGPLDPALTKYTEDVPLDELSLACSEQVHVCQERRCLIPYRDGTVRCKRHAPFPVSAEDYVLESGEWGPKRLYGSVNAWNPGVLLNARCNNDVKLLTNGGDTKNVTYYVTSYAAKKQGATYNLASVLAKGFNNHEAHPSPKYIDQLKERSRLLIFRLVHAINREQELAAPMVMSYLMGWGDKYQSHTYSPIYWSVFVAEIVKAYPNLRKDVS